MIDRYAILRRSEARVAKTLDNGGVADQDILASHSDITALFAEVDRLHAAVECPNCEMERHHNTGPFCAEHEAR